MGRWAGHSRLERVEESPLRLPVRVCTAMLGAPKGTRARAEFRCDDGSLLGEIGLTLMGGRAARGRR